MWGRVRDILHVIIKIHLGHNKKPPLLYADLSARWTVYEPQLMLRIVGSKYALAMHKMYVQVILNCHLLTFKPGRNGTTVTGHLGSSETLPLKCTLQFIHKTTISM